MEETNNRPADNNRPDEQKPDKAQMAAMRNSDLTDSPHDQERLRPEETTIDLPDVKDIPGQEFIHAPRLGMLADTTISSADEEGEGLFEVEDDADMEFIAGTEGDVTREERTTLANADENLPTDDDTRLIRASMDNTDFEGDALNEAGFGQERSGRDLDIPENIDETRTDAMGQGDEENKHYSLGSDDNDAVTEGTP